MERIYEDRRTNVCTCDKSMRMCIFSFVIAFLEMVQNTSPNSHMRVPVSKEKILERFCAWKACNSAREWEGAEQSDNRLTLSIKINTIL